IFYLLENLKCFPDAILMAISNSANKYFHDVLMNALNNKAFTDLSWIVLEAQNKLQMKILLPHYHEISCNEIIIHEIYSSRGGSMIVVLKIISSQVFEMVTTMKIDIAG
ncbi:hypothetical protein GQX74_012469, partial [Glossina fuscipes]